MIEALHKIRLLREAGMIPALLPYLLDRDWAVRVETALTVETLLESLDGASLPILDQYLRDSCEWDSSSRWRALTPVQLAALDFGSHHATALLMASFHFSGHVRQIALQELDQEETSGREIPFILLRLSDWAAPVRDTAARVLGSRIIAAHRGQFLAHLGLISRLSNRLRSSKSPALEKITRLLAQDLPALLRAAAASSDGTTWRFATNLARDAAMNDRAQQALLYDALLQGKEPRLRLQAAIWLATPDAPADLASVYLPQLLTDTSPVTRSVALGWCATREVGDISAVLHAGLLDRSGKVRALAQFYLPRRELFDVARFYREAVLHGTKGYLIAAIDGLGETGVADDARSAIPYASSPCVAFRKAAIRALARLDPATHRELFLQALQDHSPGVSRQAFLALKPAAATLSSETLETILHTVQHPHIRQRALSLSNLLPKWESVRLLVNFIGGIEETDPLYTLAGNYLNAWFSKYNRNYLVLPSPAQVASLRVAVSIGADRLDRALARELRALVDSLALQ